MATNAMIASEMRGMEREFHGSLAQALSEKRLREEEAARKTTLLAEAQASLQKAEAEAEAVKVQLERELEAKAAVEQELHDAKVASPRRVLRPFCAARARTRSPSTPLPYPLARAPSRVHPCVRTPLPRAPSRVHPVCAHAPSLVHPLLLPPLAARR
eukprot:3796069-Prymnesium_polylepis.1